MQFNLPIIVLGVYLLCMLVIFCYSISQLHIAYLYFTKCKKPSENDLLLEIKFPHVCIQLPMYNEYFVCDKIINACAKIDYPNHLLEIQVLDDSTDHTSQKIAQQVANLKQQGVNITHVQRTNREGFKAGALAEAMTKTDADFIAIFDADFEPSADFLKRTIPILLQNENIAAVQTAWAHQNRHYSLLTRMQAFALDGHFEIEQCGRHSANLFLNFNGTAGVWRKSDIEAAGNWQSDTLTEDLDLSYRAQLMGKQIYYTNYIKSPAELPFDIYSLRSQQFRWTKGAAQCFKKLFPQVVKNNIPFMHKIHATFHLFNSSIFVFIFLVSILSVPVLHIKIMNPQWNKAFGIIAFTPFSLGILCLFYFLAFRKNHNGKFLLPIFIAEFILFLSFSSAMAMHNCVALYEAYTNKKSAFVRTPKFGGIIHNLVNKKIYYQTPKLNGMFVIECSLCVYFIFGMCLGLKYNDYGLLPFHSMLIGGYGLMIYYQIKHSMLIGKS